MDGRKPKDDIDRGRLILLCGAAGAGKTTLAKQFEADGAVRMCPDEWLVALGFDVYDRDARLAVEALQWDWRLTTRSGRRPHHLPLRLSWRPPRCGSSSLQCRQVVAER